MSPINVIEILKLAMDFTNNAVSKFDEEKYANAVMVIYGHEPDYKELDTLVEIISKATDISAKEMSDLLFAIADKRSAIRKKEIEYRQECAETVNRGFNKFCKYAGKFFLGISTGGLSLIPDGYHAIKNWFNDDLHIDPRNK